MDVQLLDKANSKIALALIAKSRFSQLNGASSDAKIYLLSDGTGFIIISKEASEKPFICKHLFNDAFSSSCQSVNTISGHAFSQVRINNLIFFFTGISASNDFLFYKVTYGNSLVDWGNILKCTSGQCNTHSCESVLSEDGVLIYSFFIFGDPKYLFFATFYTNTGLLLSTTYKSNISCNSVTGSSLIYDYLIISIMINQNGILLIYNLASDSMVFKSFSNGFIYGSAIDPISSRFVSSGRINSNGYITMFAPEAIDNHPDFSSTSFSFNSLFLSITQVSSLNILSSSTTPFDSFTVSTTQPVYNLIWETTTTINVNSSGCCGDGQIQFLQGETCDDGNSASGDGCSSHCKIEDNYKCNTVSDKNYISFCTKICGNGVLDQGEICDDGNVNDGDGCSSTCQKETAFKCINFSDKPSFCYPNCGDGIRDQEPYLEQCDDCNNVDLDGCSGTCQIEENYTCQLNSNGVDVCTTQYTPPIIKSTTFYTEQLQIAITFDQKMKNLNVTDFDINLDINGPNSPYSILWSANFDGVVFKISLTTSPVLLGGINEIQKKIDNNKKINLM